jgi:hypothetical protein
MNTNDKTDPATEVDPNNEVGTPNSTSVPEKFRNAEFTEPAKAIAIWMTPTTKKKLDILKADMDVTWSLFLEIVCEQLLASKVVSKEARKKLRELGSPSVDMSSGDRYWRGAFGIGEPWPEAAACQAKILDELTLTNSLLGELVQAVEDHGTMLVECEYVMTLEDPDK